ncbi:MAG: 2-C-methyl-D-erythritol 2,4-cyclodiphosphate synthase [Gammaproteobacteria bacterium]|nr:MAG: 2-C-methyl-D-erythritol 2,4-cyclodiphosphate synthase [Gammaproteobacteria bacterium]
MRIGHGYDVHRFAEGDFVTLGGVKIPHSQALLAHSDGDVVLHALCDALLGAASLGDIGRHFPDTDPAYKGADSRGLLTSVRNLLAGEGYVVSNCDLTVVAESPKLAPHIDSMCMNIAADLWLDRTGVNVKATTTEGLGFAGRKEGIACHAVVLIEKN